MNFVLVHLGPPPPDYLWDCIEQIKKFSRAQIYLFCPYFGEAPEGVKLINEISWKKREYEAAAGWLRKEYGDFWDFAFRRLFYVEAIIDQFGLKDVIHIENDVLLYSDPESISLPRDERVWATQVGQNCSSFAYTWIPDLQSIQRMLDRTLEIFAEGKDILMARYGESMVNEMLVARQLQNEGVLGSLPLLPEDIGALEMGLFDGASYGQFVGGTRNDPPGWTGSHHFVGAEIQAGRCKIYFKENGIRQDPPMVVQNNRAERLNNLHIHCKNLREYMTP